MTAFRTYAIALLAGAALLAPRRAPGQISPGPLARAHAGLEGPGQCTKCHLGGREGMDARCLACHRGIAWLREQQRGFHARTGGATCASCHPDHAGPAFALIKWPTGSAERFDHMRTGWALEGAHAKQRCEACHSAKFQASPAARLTPQPGPARWIGLEQACASCHRDPHRGTLDTTCTTCHTLDGWKPAARFDHARSAYPLTGRHQTVACARCHTAPGGARADTTPVFKPVAHGQCSDCHQDPHRGRLGAACADCHVTTGFKTLRRDGFDHARTQFPLLGRHAAVPCAKCHDFNTARGTRPGFATCGTCHQDAHAGNAALGGAKADCAACHGVNGWTPATFTVAQHDATRYPLHGRHRAVACAACHVRPAGARDGHLGTAGVQFRPAFATCRSCHADAHGSQLAGRADSGGCEGCHKVDRWRPSTFDSTRHAALRLPLDGRHSALACEACHGLERRGWGAPAADLGRANVMLRLTATGCADCHVDPHTGRFAISGARPQPGGCRACHDTRAFRPSAITVQMHDRYTFKLEGAHRAVPCVSCHADLARPRRTTSLSTLAWTGTPLTFAVRGSGCVRCHTGPHGSQFTSRAGGGACETCHDLTAFAPASRFSHDRDTPFPLTGAHASVACARCHVPDAQGRVTYGAITGACERCHRADPPASRRR